VHDGHENRIVFYGISHIGRVNQPVLVYRHRGHLEIHHFKGSESPQNSVMLDVGGNNMLSLAFIREGYALDCVIDRFGAA